MTRPAQRRLLRIMQGRTQRQRRHHLVRRVTILTRRHAGIPALQRQAMHTPAERRRLRRVTGTAIHALGGKIIVGMQLGQIAVTTDAGIRAVGGARVFGAVHKQGNFPPRIQRLGQR
jgi:hypothetical protein